MNQYDEIIKNGRYQLNLDENWKNKYLSERRQSEYLQKEMDVLQDELEKVKTEMEVKQSTFENEQSKIVNDVNNLWTNQLLEVFHQVEKKGVDMGDISIPAIQADDDSKSIHNNENTNADENPTIKNLKKNLVRIYTKTEWNEDDLNALRQEMNIELNNLNKEKIIQMTDPSRSYNQNEQNYQRLYEDLQRQSEQTTLEYQQRLQEQKMIFDLEIKMLVDSKMQLVNAVSNELQHLRDLIKAYNPEYRYKTIMNKVVRYNFPQDNGDTLFQLMQDSGLSEMEFKKKNMLSNIKMKTITQKITKTRTKNNIVHS